EQLARLQEIAVDAGLLPPGDGLPTLRRQLRVFRANLGAYLRYQPSVVARKLYLFRTIEEGEADPSRGWNALTTEPVEVLRVPGDHYTFLSRENVAVWA